MIILKICIILNSIKGLHIVFFLIYFLILILSFIKIVFIASRLKFILLSLTNKVVINNKLLVTEGLFYNNIKKFFNYYN